MADEPKDQSSEASPPSSLTRRDVISGTLAAAGLGAAAVSPTVNATSAASYESRIPISGRGYFTSDGAMFIPRGQGFDATNAEFYEVPLESPDYLEIWCYTDKISYLPGEVVTFHTSTTGRYFSLEIFRDGLERRTVYTVSDLPGKMYRLPSDFYDRGCGWPVSHRWEIPANLPSGFYVVVCRTSSDRTSVTERAADDPTVRSEQREQEHGFFVRPALDSQKADILLIASTCTWTAYNDWGGFSHYVGYNLPNKFTHAPRLTLHRPFARGIIWSPEGSPRKPHELPFPPNAIPRYPVIEFAYTRGYSKWYTNCGWATYERNFAIFAEREGFGVDYATQLDLHYDPHLLNGYRCVAVVGHSEYWSWEMREAIDRYIENGGNVARFAGNFAWQIRLEDNGLTQVAYKDRAHDSDPIRNTDQKRRLTGLWEDPSVDWFGAETFGLNATYGVYAHVGVQVPRGTGGFTVYRPEHWALKGTDLYYGDDFGGEAKIFGYEVDGLDYTFRDGVPYPTFKDRAQKSTEIIAMALASNREANHGHKGSVFYYGDGSEELAKERYGTVNEETKRAGGYGNGMVITFQRGKGTVFHAGSSEWVAGLKHRDYYTETITRNVLAHFTAKG
jgi:hypothetical protein